MAGTDAAGLLLDKLTSTPPAPAAAPSVTVPVAFSCPPTTVDGRRPKPEIVPRPAEGALMVRLAFTVFAEVAVIVAGVVLATADVVTVKTPADWPCGMMILAGTLAAGLLLDRLTSTPPTPAGDPKVTVAVAFACPPTTTEGAIPKPEIVPEPGEAAFKVNPAFTVFAEVAVIVIGVVLPTAEVVTVNVPEV